VTRTAQVLTAGVPIPTTFAYDIFLSHCAKDKQIVLPLADRLQRDGLRVWLFEHEVKGSPIILDKIEAGLTASQLLLLTVSWNGEGSEWMKLERAFFLHPDPTNRQRRIIVLRLDETKPSGILVAFNHLDWRERSDEEYTQLLEVLKTSVPTPDPTIAYPSIARVYDYLLGGEFNTAVDREAAEKLVTAFPDFRAIVLSNRAFLRRAVRYCALRGIRQFLDVGSGLPTRGNTHEIARSVCPEAKVIYVDNDKEVVDWSNALMRHDGNTFSVLGDLRDPESILRASVLGHIDFHKPVALLLAAILHFIVDDEVAGKSLARLRRELTPGSYVAISHASVPGALSHSAKSAERYKQVQQLLKLYPTLVAPVTVRSSARVRQFFDGPNLVEPGLVFAPAWHPKVKDPYIAAGELPFVDEPRRSLVLVGVESIGEA
jgi:hypothetical protein